jgi:hypothetical protein
MATKGVNPFAKFEKSPADKDTPAVTRKFGKEGSATEEAFDKKQGGFPRKFVEGGPVTPQTAMPPAAMMPRPPGGGMAQPMGAPPAPAKGYAAGGMVRRGWGKARGA